MQAIISESGKAQSFLLDHSFELENDNHLIKLFAVSEAEKEKLAEIYREIEHVQNNLIESDYVVLAKFFAQKIKLQAPLFSSHLLKLHAQRNEIALFVSNLPSLNYETLNLVLAELVSLSFAFLVGEPFQYLQQNDSRLVAHISPKVGLEMSQSGLSRGNFGWHTDDRLFADAFRTDWIQLLGVYNPDHAETILAPIDPIIEKLSPITLSILMEKRFEVKMPASFGFKNNIWSEPVNLIWMNEFGQYEVGVPTYNVKTIHANDLEAQNALDEFLKTIDMCRSSVTLSYDSLLVFNNNRLLHGRTPIKSDRLVMRTYIRGNLDDLRKQTNTTGHIFDARFLL